MALTGCCCCFSLRTGTLILAVLGAIGSLTLFIEGIQGDGVISIIQGIGLFAYLSCIYAVVKEKAVWMIPSLIWSIISSILSIIGLILTFVAYGALKALPVDELTQEEKQYLEYLQYIIVFITIVYICAAALSIYFYCVMYAFYQVLKNGSDIATSNKNVV